MQDIRVSKFEWTSAHTLLAGFLLACAAGEFIIAAAPLQMSIATIFLFAGVHNFMEFRYFAARMPLRWGKSRLFYSIGIGGPMGVDQGTLKKIAAETGGRAFFPRHEADLDAAYTQIDEDLRSQYILAYTPANPAKDGSFRTIQVKVKNHGDLTVRHRRGYFAPS